MTQISYNYDGVDVLLSFDDDEQDDVQRSYDYLQGAGIEFVMEVK